jgi:hypothetical protein
MAKQILLTQGKTAIVDDEDFEALSKYKWHAVKVSRMFYANRLQVITRKSIRMQWHIIGKPQKGLEIDHINRNGLDNRKENLRFVTKGQNVINSDNYSSNTSGIRGVHWHKTHRKWGAKIVANGKQISLGYFDNIEDAKKARRAAEQKYFFGGSNE